ncbi:apoptosis inhibitory protein 5-domain-containing protein [Mycena galericulata]|nr:apoptosis inhibitory protein 5-domain-containing protein [Mycena galericulata]
MEHGVREEREIRDLIRHASGSSEKSGVLRRKALNKLIDLTHTPNTPLKILAAKTIPELFNDFPDLEEAAINAVYDLCEDQSATVRKEGYDAITAVSKAANKWVKRNTDVLLQLLQSDEPDEVVVVKQALIAHLNLDPRVTLGVLCDQIMPAVDATVDPDELYMRDRLRTLVLAFLTDEAKQVIVEKHAVPGSDAESVLVDGLLTALPKLTPTDTDIIVKQLLLDLHSFRSGSTRGKALLITLLEKAQTCLKTDAKAPIPTLATTRFYMDLMAYVAIEKSLGSPIDLLRFYLPALVTKMTIPKFSADDQNFIICSMAETLAACEEVNKGPDSAQLSILRNHSVAAAPNLFECLVNSGIAHERPRNACKVLLQACLRRKAEGWTVPAHLRSLLETLRAKSEGFRDVQELIRSLAAQDKTPPNGSDKTAPPVAGTSLLKPIAQDTPALNRPPVLASLRRSLTSRDSPVASTSASRSSSNEASTHNKHSLGPDSSPRPPKRARTGSDQPPSLLSRLADTTSKGSERRPDMAQRAAPQQPAFTARPTESERTPRNGFSIKGAAAKEAGEPHRAGGSTAPSLLDRIDNGGRSDDHRARRKQRL